ncbi:MAG: NapC/NirT family cytochrome c [Desulfobacterales bacterium]|nr:NapC/NirT family cytochrome c [Desulfobacterales bacterium]
MKDQGSKRRVWVIVTALLLLGVALAVPMEMTSRTEFCVSCHEITPHKAELEKSSHALDKDKNPIQCRQCHIPHGLGPKFLAVKVMGLKDLWVHYVEAPEGLDRRAGQIKARRYVQDDNCLVCHPNLLVNVKDEPISEQGRLSHENYLGKNGKGCRKCAECHFNLAHLPDFDRRYDFNAKFAAKIPREKERN